MQNLKLVYYFTNPFFLSVLIEFGWGQFNMEEEAKLLDENRNKITQLTVITDGRTVLVIPRCDTKAVAIKREYFFSFKQTAAMQTYHSEAKIFCISD